VASKLAPFALLTGASVATLPVLYGMAQRLQESPIMAVTFVALGLGLLAMGLAWAAGASLEDRRRGSVRFVGVMALAPFVVAGFPGARVAFVATDYAWLGASALLSIVALVMLSQRWRR